MNSTVSEKGQITIPQKLRNQLGLKPGVVIDFENINGKLVGIKRSKEDPLLNWIGKGQNPTNPSNHPATDDYLATVRNR
jgi:AbrB family looped-hinge helix DNA binding protein